MPWLSDLKRALHRLGETEQPRAERRPISGVTALFGSQSAPTAAGIKDISSSGIYLFTQERPAIGELSILTLRTEGMPERNSDLQFSVQAHVATHGEDGIALSFVLPAGMDLGLWGVLIRNIAELTDRDQIAETFRSLRTILFLCRICHSGAEEPILLLGGQLDTDRTDSLFKIALIAENLLAAEPDVDRLRAHPKMVASILSEGAWASDEQTIQLWAGLLASSCSLDAPGEFNKIFADLLVHITPTEARIFVYACQHALGSAQGTGTPAASIVLTPKQIVEITGVHDLYRNATDLAYLFNLGLVQKVFDFTSYHDAESFDVTPTSLGLELYKHCHGSREVVEPGIVEAASTHLANFLPAPQPAAESHASHTAPSSSGSQTS